MMFGRKPKPKPAPKSDMWVEVQDHTYRSDKETQWEGHIYEKAGFVGVVIGKSRYEVLAESQRLSRAFHEADRARDNAEVIEL